MPELYEENQKLFECFTLCDSQLRAGGMGIIGLDWNVVIQVARTMKIQIDDDFFRKLKGFEQIIMERINARK